MIFLSRGLGLDSLRHPRLERFGILADTQVCHGCIKQIRFSGPRRRIIDRARQQRRSRAAENIASFPDSGIRHVLLEAK